jgi:hypothetical protein
MEQMRRRSLDGSIQMQICMSNEDLRLFFSDEVEDISAAIELSPVTKHHLQ